MQLALPAPGKTGMKNTGMQKTGMGSLSGSEMIGT